MDPLARIVRRRAGEAAGCVQGTRVGLLVLWGGVGEEVDVCSRRQELGTG